MSDSSAQGSIRLIVADDLTGAADAGVKFLIGHRSVAVVPDLDRATVDSIRSADVVSISADTRRRAAGDVRGRVTRAAAFAAAPGSGSVLLKIDSTLRGHVGEEVTAAMEAFGSTHAILTPAFPAMNRRVAGGSLIVEGLAAPPPVDICTRLTDQGVTGALALRSPITAADLRQAIDRGARVLVVDASTRADLDAAVAAGLAAGGRPLWAGSAGLAEALAEALAADSSSDGPLPPARPPARQGPIVLCIGSTHPATRAQEARLTLRRQARVLRVAPATWRTTLQELDGLARGGIGGLVLTGGDTATTVCSALRVDALDLRGEVANGVPWGLLRGGPASGAPVVLKSGAFGGAETLVDAVDFLSATMGAHGDD